MFWSSAGSVISMLLIRPWVFWKHTLWISVGEALCVFYLQTEFSGELGESSSGRGKCRGWTLLAMIRLFLDSRRNLLELGANRKGTAGLRRGSRSTLCRLLSCSVEASDTGSFWAWWSCCFVEFLAWEHWDRTGSPCKGCVFTSDKIGKLVVLISWRLDWNNTKFA